MLTRATIEKLWQEAETIERDPHEWVGLSFARLVEAKALSNAAWCAPSKESHDRLQARARACRRAAEEGR